MTLEDMNERLRRTVRRYLELALSDALVVVVSLWISWSIRSVTATLHIEPLFIFTVLSVLAYWLSNFVFRLYHRIWKYASAADLVPIVGSTLLGTSIVTALDLLWPERRPIPLSVVATTACIVFAGFTAVRYRRRLWTGIRWRLQALWGRPIGTYERVLIIGAGEAGEIFARRFLSRREGVRYHLVGFVDDDPSKHEMRLHDLPILGDHTQIPEIVAKHRVDLIVIAIYNITGENFRSILEASEKTQARIKVIPDLMDFIQDRTDIPTIRDISAEDLLGRKVVEIDETACRELLEGRRILVTGAAGSIGSELCRQILSYKPARLMMLDNNESGLYELCGSLTRSDSGKDVKGTADRLQAIVGSVTNRSKVSYLFEKHRPEIVFHAAAYKHVPMMEEQPDEAMWVNVWGAKNMVELSKEYDVERFVFVSTDKSVQPVCIMGATKWLGELMMMHPDAWARRGRSAEAGDRRRKPRGSQERKASNDELERSEVRPGTLFTAVRFGNVLASRGSVVPTFEQQIKAGGPVMVTHPEMTRYFMSITEAVRLIIQAATFTQGQDIFMLNMGERIKIDDLARRLIRLRGARPGIDIKIVYSGIRPGEKLHEELMGPTETRLPTKHICIFRIQKNHAPDPEVLANEIDHLLDMTKEHKNQELAERLQLFVAKEEGQQPDGLVISFKGKVSELVPAAKEADNLGQLDRALELYSEALQLSEGVHNRTSDLMCWIGDIHRRKGDYSTARDFLLQSQELSRKYGYVAGLVPVSIALGFLNVDSQNYKLALKHYRTALKLSVLYGFDVQKAPILAQIGAVYERNGSYRKAISAYKRALELSKGKEESTASAFILYNIGSCYLKSGRSHSSEQYLFQSAILFRKLKDTSMVARIYLKLSRLSLQRRDRHKSREQVEQAIEILMPTGVRKELAEAYLILGTVLRQEGKLGLAEENLKKALALATEANVPMVLGDAYVELALWNMDQGLEENGLKHLSLAASEYSKISTNGELKEVEEKTPELEMLFMKIAREFGDSHDRVSSFAQKHCWRVALYCVEISEWMGLPPDQKKALVTAAFLHDIGERNISQEIFEKKGPLNDEERMQVKQHVVFSAKMIEEIHFPWPEVLAYVKYHHERYNGEGYPLGLRGEEIHLGARILALTDYFVAITADRPHRKALSVQKALESIRAESGKMFDPKLVEIFVHPAFVDRVMYLNGTEQNHFDFDRLWSRIQRTAGQKEGLVFKFGNQPSGVNDVPEKNTKFGM